jgi:hypothetical protein
LSDLLISDSSRPEAGFRGFPQSWHKTPPSIKREGRFLLE